MKANPEIRGSMTKKKKYIFCYASFQELHMLMANVRIIEIDVVFLDLRSFEDDFDSHL